MQSAWLETSLRSSGGAAAVHAPQALDGCMPPPSWRGGSPSASRELAGAVISVQVIYLSWPHGRMGAWAHGAWHPRMHACTLLLLLLAHAVGSCSGPLHCTGLYLDALTRPPVLVHGRARAGRRAGGRAGRRVACRGGELCCVHQLLQQAGLRRGRGQAGRQLLRRERSCSAGSSCSSGCQLCKTALVGGSNSTCSSCMHVFDDTLRMALHCSSPVLHVPASKPHVCASVGAPCASFVLEALMLPLLLVHGIACRWAFGWGSTAAAVAAGGPAWLQAAPLAGLGECMCSEPSRA
jgi:hypothetical protein